MKVRAFLLSLAVVAAPVAMACSKEVAVDNSGKGSVKAASASGEGVANLPFSHGRSFKTLDDYLAHLERHAAPVDQPWWREVSPGVYEHVKRLPGAPRETATREELMTRFGFTR